MIKWWLVSGLLLCSMTATAQLQPHVDSLFMVKDYLQLLQQTVTGKKVSLQQKVGQVDSLLRQGQYYEQLFNKHLPAVVGSVKEREALDQYFRFILQSAILFKTDARQSAYKSRKSIDDEVLYMTEHIPPLVHNIYYYCSKALKNIRN